MRQTRYLLLGGLPILLGVILFLAVNVLYQRVIEADARRGLWFESFDSKVAFMLAGGRHDLVFLGSSRTHNHINTRLLKERGIDAFNMGLPSRELFDQLDSLYNAVQVARKYVVVCTPASQLFSTNVKFPARPTLRSFAWFSLHYPRSVHMDRFLKIFPLNRNKGIVETYNWGMAHAAELEETMRTVFGQGPEDDPRKVNYIRERGDPNRPPRLVVLYENGDGAVFCRDIPPGLPLKVKDLTRERPSDAILGYINRLAEICREHSLTLVLNLIADRPAVKYRLDMEAIRAKLPDCVVLDSQPDFPSEWWADGAHLGHDAADAYTEALAAQLKELPGLR